MKLLLHYLNWLFISPNHRFTITFPQKMDLFSSPGFRNFQGHFKPASPPPWTSIKLGLLHLCRFSPRSWYIQKNYLQATGLAFSASSRTETSKESPDALDLGYCQRLRELFFQRKGDKIWQYYSRRSKGISNFIRCKVLLGGFGECDPFRGKERGEGFQRARFSIESAGNQSKSKVNFVYTDQINNSQICF